MQRLFPELNHVMTKAEAKELISSLESGHAGIETFLELSGGERAMIMTMLEQRAEAKELRQTLEQREADRT